MLRVHPYCSMQGWGDLQYSVYETLPIVLSQTTCPNNAPADDNEPSDVQVMEAAYNQKVLNVTLDMPVVVHRSDNKGNDNKTEMIVYGNHTIPQYAQCFARSSMLLFSNFKFIDRIRLGTLFKKRNRYGVRLWNHATQLGRLRSWSLGWSWLWDPLNVSGGIAYPLGSKLISTGEY